MVSKGTVVEFVATTDVTNALRDAIEVAKDADALAPVWVVVPSGAAAGTTLNTLAAQHGVINVRFLTVQHLCDALTMSSAGDLPKLGGAAGRELVRHAAATAQAPLDVYQLDVLAKSLEPIFEDLRHRSPLEIERIGEVNTLSAELVRLYQTFLHSIAGRFVDSVEGMQRAAQAVPALLDVTPVVAVMAEPPGFYQSLLFGALADAGRLKVIAVSSGIAELDSMLETWLWGLGSSSTRSVPQRRPVDKMYVAPDADTEVQVAVGELLRHAQQGVSFSRMAILYGASTPYARIVEDQMRSAGIPSRGAASLTLGQTTAGGFVLRLLDVIESGFQFDQVAAWLLCFPNASAGDWLHVARLARVSGDEVNWAKRLQVFVTEESARRANQPNVASAEAFLGFIEAFIAWNQTEVSSWQQGAQWLQAAIELYLGSHGERTSWRHSDGEAAVVVEGRLARLAALDPVAGPVDKGRFVSAVREDLSAAPAQTGVGRRGVFVGTVGQALGCDFDVTVVCGMAEGLYPRAADVNGLMANVVVPGEESRTNRDRRIFRLRMGSAGYRVLTTPAADVRNQRTLRASSLLLEEAALLAGRAVNAGEVCAARAEWPWLEVMNSFSEIVARPQLQASPQHDNLTALRHHVDAGADCTEYEYWATGSDATDSGNRDAFLTGVEALRGRDSAVLTRFDGLVNSKVPFGGDAGVPLRPTQVEQWAVCPFKYLLSSILAVETVEDEPSALSMSPRDRGELVHAVLEEFMLRVPPRTSPQERWSDDERLVLHALTDARFDLAIERGRAPEGFVTDIERKTLHRHLDVLLDDDEEQRRKLNVVPVAVEQRFGDTNTPAVSVELKNGEPVWFRGRIDRIDSAPDKSRVVVTDYKTGRAKSSDVSAKDPVAAGTKLQLAIYAKAAQSMYPDAEVSADYWFVTDAQSKYKRVGISLDDTTQSRIGDVFEGLSSSFDQGAFPAVPGEDDGRSSFANCRSCDYDAICVRDRSEAWSRKSTDPAVHAYVGLSEVDGAARQAGGDQK